MLNVVYYVACSLDGYIATEDGGVERLELVETCPCAKGVVQLTYEPTST